MDVSVDVYGCVWGVCFSVCVCYGQKDNIFFKLCSIKDLLASENKEMFLVKEKFERKQECQTENENESFSRKEKRRNNLIRFSFFFC